jgi:hypothetical protein
MLQHLLNSVLQMAKSYWIAGCKFLMNISDSMQASIHYVLSFLLHCSWLLETILPLHTVVDTNFIYYWKTRCNILARIFNM